MLKDKVILTYKRKRLSYQADVARHTKENGLSPNMQMGSSWICSPKSEPDANDEKFENHHSVRRENANALLAADMVSPNQSINMFQQAVKLFSVR